MLRSPEYSAVALSSSYHTVPTKAGADGLSFQSAPQDAKLPRQADAFLELQRELTPWIYVAFLCAGVAFGLASELFADPMPAGALSVILLLGIVVAWLISLRSYVAGMVALNVGSVLVILLAQRWYPASNAHALLALPCGLLMLMRGPRAGFAAAILSVVWLTYTGSHLSSQIGRSQSLVAVYMVLGVLALIWLALKPGHMLTAWSWSQYSQARKLLEEARDRQMVLKQTQDDLLEANKELARMASHLRAMYRVTEEARQAKAEFVANVSHELRTPLNMILGFSEMITQAPQVYGEPMAPPLLADIEIILRNAQHLSALIDDVLDLSQAEADRMTLSKTQNNLASIVREAIVAVEPLYDAKHLYLTVEAESDLPDLYCDRTRIRQVLLNLLSNAVRFTDQGGVMVQLRQEGRSLLVGVADTGHGIPEPSMERIFEPFHQGDHSIRRPYNGTGLGLSISKRYVEMHGGAMWVESKIGRGTTFYFSLPMEDLSAYSMQHMTSWVSEYSQPEPRIRPSRVPQHKLAPRYIVMESGDTLQRLLARYQQDREIVGVHSREEALQELRRAPAHALVINDPNPDAVKMSLEDERLLIHDTPILTCWAPGVDEAAKRLGVVSYLVKPISRQTLLTTLDSLQIPLHTILMADDEAEILQLFGRSLGAAGRGYQILRASNGQHALSLLYDRHPDVLLLDLVMSGMDGFELLKIKEKDPQIRDIPVIVTSALDPDGEPIVSTYLSVVQRGGLSMRDLSNCIGAVSEVLHQASARAYPAPKAAPAG